MADTPLPGTVAKYRDYGGVFTALFEAAAAPAALSDVLALSYHDVVNHVDSYPDLASVDAVLITGSKHSAFGDDAWTMALVAYVRDALATGGRVKVVGVCFGHQIVARAMQTPVVVNDNGWEVAVTELELSEEGKEVFGLETLG
jgi:GMP synthase (glutamine-hydrolysing)